ncbi:hypothetical protein BH11PAT1_BH11PAT1_1890 [soil metagenome]
MDINQFFTQKRVFYISCKTDPYVLLAITPVFQSESKLLYWWDTIKVSCREIKSIQRKQNEQVDVVDTEDNHYTLFPLTLKLYDTCIKSQLVGKESFNSEEELLKAFT